MKRNMGSQRSAEPGRGACLPARPAAVCLALLLVMLLAAGCGRIQSGRLPQSGGLSIALAVEPDPPAVGPAQLVITLRDRAGRAVSGAQVTAEGNMTHAGMQPVSGSAAGGADGRYRMPFEWTMDGDWVVTVKATLPDGRAAAQQFPLRVGGG